MFTKVVNCAFFSENIKDYTYVYTIQWPKIILKFPTTRRPQHDINVDILHLVLSYYKSSLQLRCNMWSFNISQVYVYHSFYERAFHVSKNWKLCAKMAKFQINFKAASIEGNITLYSGNLVKILICIQCKNCSHTIYQVSIAVAISRLSGRMCKLAFFN